MTGRTVAGQGRPGRPYAYYLLLLAPLYLYVASCWLVEPTSLTGSISLSSLIPMAFVLGLFLMRIPRAEFVGLVKRLGVEFALLSLMLLLCVLSLINHEEPFRAFRILFPCALPLLLFVQMAAVRGYSPAAISAVPRAFVLAALLFSCLPLLLSSFAGGLRDMIFVTHRYKGFFENANQHAIMLAVALPVAIGELVESRRARSRCGWAFVVLLLFYTLVRTGTKTALLVSLVVCWLFYILINLRSYSPAKRVLLFGGMMVLALGVMLFGLQAAEAIDPTLGRKLRMIFSEGLFNYYSMESRQVLWEEAVRDGSKHWLVGAGAGEKVGGLSHAHNLVLNYFRGIGLFGAIAIGLLCVAIVWRGARKGYSVVLGRPAPGDRRRWACYTAAVVYVICNQLSDSFGPTTIAALWLVYLPAVLSERPATSCARARRSAPSPWPPSVAAPVPQAPR